MPQLSLSMLAFAKVPFEVAIQTIAMHSSIRMIDIVPQFWHQDRSHRPVLDRYGIGISSAHAVLYPREDLNIFHSPHQRGECLTYLREILTKLNDYGCPILSFGSAKNRRLPPQLPPGEVLKIGTEFFQELCDAAALKKIKICIEPQAQSLGCDFIVNNQQAFQFVNQVGHSHLLVNLDTGNMLLDPAYQDYDFSSLRTHLQQIGIIHINNPGLKGLRPGLSDQFHGLFSQFMGNVGYDGTLSLEIFANEDQLLEEIHHFQNCYERQPIES